MMPACHILILIFKSVGYIFKVEKDVPTFSTECPLQEHFRTKSTTFGYRGIVPKYLNYDL